MRAPRANYVADENPWNLAGPPTWFLTELATFDPDLVILPGKTAPVYRLTRRVRRGLGLQHAAMGQDSETARLIRHRLVPVTAILPTTTWGPHIFAHLRARDTWAAGGAQKFTDDLDASEAAADARQTAERRDTLEHGIGPSAWWSYKMRQGSTVMLPGQSGTSTSRAAAPAGAPAG